MDDPPGESVLSCWAELRAYAMRLVADLSDEQMVAQPVPGAVMNHPAWILSHLSAYAPVLAGILRGEAVRDPLDHRYGRNSRPEADPDAYLPREDLIRLYCQSYDDAADAVRAVPTRRLREATPIQRWRSRFATIGDLPIQFLVKHNAVHLGQLSAWRRAGGLAPVG